MIKEKKHPDDQHFPPRTMPMGDKLWILRLNFHRKSASKCWIREIIIVPLIDILIH